MVVNGLPIQLVGSALSGLNVESCVHSCQGSPCGAGICSPNLDTFSCQCPLGWGGESCSTPTPDSSPIPGSTPAPVLLLQIPHTIPGSTPTPDFSPIPGSTPTPDFSTIPGSTSTPDSSSKPGITPTPDSSPLPGKTPTPDSSTIPGSTSTPDSYTIPGKVVLLLYQELEQE